VEPCKRSGGSGGSERSRNAVYKVRCHCGKESGSDRPGWEAEIRLQALPSRHLVSVRKIHFSYRNAWRRPWKVVRKTCLTVMGTGEKRYAMSPSHCAQEGVGACPGRTVWSRVVQIETDDVHDSQQVRQLLISRRHSHLPEARVQQHADSDQQHADSEAARSAPIPDHGFRTMDY